MDILLCYIYKKYLKVAVNTTQLKTTLLLYNTAGFDFLNSHQQVSILNEWKIHPYMSVLKLPLLVYLQQKVGELLLSI
jgi:hypothetical protein